LADAEAKDEGTNMDSHEFAELISYALDATSSDEVVQSYVGEDSLIIITVRDNDGELKNVTFRLEIVQEGEAV
jgi:hypothetical protein